MHVIDSQLYDEERFLPSVEMTGSETGCRVTLKTAKPDLHIMQEAFVKTAVLPILLLLSVSALAADIAASSKVYAQLLLKKDIAELSGIVCEARHNVRQDNINAWSNKPRDLNNAHAAVACKPHVVTDNYAVYYKAVCQRGDKWGCKDSETWVHAKLGSRQIDIGTGGYKPELAYSLVGKIASYRTAKGDPVLETSSTRCNLAKGPSKDMLDVTCDDQLFRLSYWCPKSSCPRIFSINGYFVPADAGGL